MPVTIWDLITAYRDETGATEAWIMRKAGLNKGAFTAWRKRGVPVLPERPVLFALAETLRVDYETVVLAMLHAGKYLPEEEAREEERRHAEAIEIENARALEAHRLAVELFTTAGRDFENARALASRRYQSDEITLDLWERVDDSLREMERFIAAAHREGGDDHGTATTEEPVSEDSDELLPAAKPGQVEEPGENSI